MKCLRPECGRTFTPLPKNARKQKVCGRAECRKWYKRYWAEVAPPPRGMADEQWDRVEKSLKPGTVLGALVVTARETGLRLSELLGLTVADVFEGLGGRRKVRQFWIIRGQRVRGRFKETKTKRARYGFPGERCPLWLTAVPGLLAARLDEWVFPVSGGWAWEWWKRLQKRLAIVNPATGDGYRFHDLRHTLGTELVKKKEFDLAQKALGHKSLETTMRYAQRSPEDLAEAIAAARRRK